MIQTDATPQGPLHVSTSSAEIAHAYALWREKLIVGARPLPRRRYWNPSGGWAEIDVEERLTNKHDPLGSEKLHASLGLDGAGAARVITLNTPTTTSYHALGAVASDGSGRHWLLRRGFLRPQRGEDTVNDEMFSAQTRLLPVAVDIERPSICEYYSVANLEANSDQVAAQTFAFVAECAAIRSYYDIGGGDAGLRALTLERALRETFTILDAPPEQGGTIQIPPQDETVRLRRHGYVWAALHDLFVHERISHKKISVGPYEVDMIVHRPNRPLLIEIKTASTAGDVHAGVGQLANYRHLFREVGDLASLLLIPRGMHALLAAAVRAHGIHLLHFELSDTTATFDKPDLLALCRAHE